MVGDDCLLMAYSHIAHDCQIGNNVVIANAVNMAGHVFIEDWSIIGGLTAIHQFVRIGAHAFVGGASRTSQDVPPYTRAAGSPMKLYGLNSIGLDRRGFSPEVRQALKKRLSGGVPVEPSPFPGLWSKPKQRLRMSRRSGISSPSSEPANGESPPDGRRAKDRSGLESWGLGAWGSTMPGSSGTCPDLEMRGSLRGPARTGRGGPSGVGSRGSFGSLEALLDIVDAVVVAVPTVEHEAVAVAALERGIHVLIEKPMAPDSGRCRPDSLRR